MGLVQPCGGWSNRMCSGHGWGVVVLGGSGVGWVDGGLMGQWGAAGWSGLVVKRQGKRGSCWWYGVIMWLGAFCRSDLGGGVTLYDALYALPHVRSRLRGGQSGVSRCQCANKCHGRFPGRPKSSMMSGVTL